MVLPTRRFVWEKKRPQARTPEAAQRWDEETKSRKFTGIGRGENRTPRCAANTCKTNARSTQKPRIKTEHYVPNYKRFRALSVPSDLNK